MASALPVILAIACGSDVSGPCARPYACEVDGVDLVIAGVRLAEPAGIDPATQRPVAPPGDVAVEFVVRNRGTLPSQAVEVYTGWKWTLNAAVRDSIPTLAPGDSAVRRVSLPVNQSWKLYRPDHDPMGDVIPTQVVLMDHHDAVSANDEAVLEAHIPIALLEPYIAPVTAAKVRIGDSIQVNYRLRNLSTRATATGITLRLCLWANETACVPGTWSTFGNVAVPDLSPGSEFEVTRNVILPPTASWHDEDYLRVLSVCIVHSSWTDAYLPREDVCTGTWSYIRVLPDYEGVCNAPTLVPGTPFSFASHNCGHMDPTSQQQAGGGDWQTWIDRLRFHVVAVDAEAGRSYTLERSRGTGMLQIFDSDGGNAPVIAAGSSSFSFREAGRFYIVMYTDWPALTLTLQ